MPDGLKQPEHSRFLGFPVLWTSKRSDNNHRLQGRYAVVGKVNPGDTIFRVAGRRGSDTRRMKHPYTITFGFGLREKGASVDVQRENQSSVWPRAAGSNADIRVHPVIPCC